MNYAVVDQSGNVVNVISWDGISPYNPGAGLTLVRSDTAARGHVYQNGQFTNPNESRE